MPQLECAQVLANDLRHAHTQRRRYILHGHFYLPIAILQQFRQVTRQLPDLSGREEINRKAFFIGHATELANVYGRIEAELRSRYLVAFNAERKEGEKKVQELEGQVEAGKEAVANLTKTLKERPSAVQLLPVWAAALREGGPKEIGAEAAKDAQRVLDDKSANETDKARAQAAPANAGA